VVLVLVHVVLFGGQLSLKIIATLMPNDPLEVFLPNMRHGKLA
jgi:hypothetical protein